MRSDSAESTAVVGLLPTGLLLHLEGLLLARMLDLERGAAHKTKKYGFSSQHSNPKKSALSAYSKITTYKIPYFNIKRKYIIFKMRERTRERARSGENYRGLNRDPERARESHREDNQLSLAPNPVDGLVQLLHSCLEQSKTSQPKISDVCKTLMRDSEQRVDNVATGEHWRSSESDG